MKVLLVQKVAGISGSENYLLNILPALNNKGIVAEFLCLYEKKDREKIQEFLNSLTSLNVKYHLFQVPSIPGPFTFYRLSRFLKKARFNLVHTNLLHSDLILALTKMFFFRDLVLVSGKHGFDEMYIKNYGFNVKEGFSNKYTSVARFAERYINRSFAISKGIINVFTGLKIAKKEKIDLVYYGFDFSYSSFEKSSLRRSSKQILIVGRLVPYKGHELVIKALPGVLKRIPDISLVIVGGGFYEQTLKNLVAELKLEQHVYFEGHRKNVKEYLFNSDVLGVPSIAEGFGIVYLEAFSQKKAVIGFDVPAGNEIIIHNETGILVKPYDVDELSEKLIEIFSNSKKLTEMGENGYLKLKQYYTLERMVDETIQFYKIVL